MKLTVNIRKHTLYPYLVWGLGSLFALYAFMLQGAPSVMIPQLMQTYKIDLVQIGILTSSFFYTYIILQVPAGMAVDLWGPRRILIIGFIICSCTLFWFAYSHSFWEGQVSRMMMGLVASPAIISSFCIGSRWFKPALFPLIVALTEFIALAGGIIGEGGLALSVVHLGWRETMTLIAIFGLIFVFLAFFFIHDFPPHFDQPLHNGQSFKKTLKKTWNNLISLLKIKQIWVNGIYAGLMFGLFPAFAALWGIPYFSLRYNVTVDIAASAASMFFVGACLGTLTLGWLSLYIANRRRIMMSGALIAFFFSLSVIYIPQVSLTGMFILVTLLGFSCSSYALAFTLVGNLVPHDKKGVAMGLTNMLCIAFGAPVLQPLIGFLLKLTTPGRLKTYSTLAYGIALSPLPICLLLAFFLAFFIKKPQLTTSE